MLLFRQRRRLRHIPVGKTRWVGTKRWSIQGNIVLSSCRYGGIILHATFVEEDSKGQICTNGASSDRISKNTLKNKVVVFVIECWNETEISEGNHNENANWQA